MTQRARGRFVRLAPMVAVAACFGCGLADGVAARIRNDLSPAEAAPLLTMTAAGRPDTRIPHTATFGIEGGSYSIRSDDFKPLIEDGTYVGLRYSRDVGLGSALSVAAGYYKAKVTVPGEKIESIPVRATLEFGRLLGAGLSRWYFGGGGGYSFAQVIPTTSPLDTLESEWTAHAVMGFEFREEGVVTTRLEAGHTWLITSRADVWTAMVALSFQF